MTRIKIANIVGARPQFVKSSALHRAIKASPKQIDEILIHTGQHYCPNMSAIFFQELEIKKPDYHLEVKGTTHGSMTGRMMEKIEEVLLKEKPDWLVVFGDTNSTLAGALAASKLHIPIAHIEAGLRSYNRKMPEEINRILTDHTSDLLFTPSDVATQNLLAEGIPSEKIRFSGDVMYDVALHHKTKSLQEAPHFQDYILCTVHRAENTDNIQQLKQIFEGLFELAKYKKVVIPLHPRTHHALEQCNFISKVKQQLHVIEPASFSTMMNLITHAAMIVTDSGGLQKEAFYFHKPCLTLRTETEWVELASHGYSHLPKLTPEGIVAGYQELSQAKHNWDVNLYGTGKAAESILLEMVQS